jgi:hypothetical protein
MQNVAELFTSNSLMSGGKASNKISMEGINSSSKQNFILISLFTYLIILLIKGFIVYLLYNLLMPKLIYSLSENKSLEMTEINFKPISFSESILLVIFTNTLFSS